MENVEKSLLEKMVLAPYVQKSTALQGKYRFVGGNQFRHAISTFGILLDYHCLDPVVLKASFIHDLFEDTKGTLPEEIINLDSDGKAVYDLVMEVTRQKSETKDQFLERILTKGSRRAKLLKCADRISNLTDLHSDIFDKNYILKYMDETKRWVVPMAEEVNRDMLIEIKDIMRRREVNLHFTHHFWPMKRTNE